MRKITNLLTIIFLPFISILSSSVIYPEKNIDQLYMDFHSDEEQVLLDLSYYDNEILPIEKHKSEVRFYLNDELLDVKKYEMITKVNYEYNFPKNILKESNVVYIRIIYQSDFVETGFTFEYLPKPEITINNFEEKYHGNIYAVIVKGYAITRIYENIEFSNFYDVLENDVYYRIDLDRLKIKMNCIDMNTLKDVNPYLRLYVSNGCFPRLSYNQLTNSYDIPLEIIAQNNTLGFKFKTMYFDEINRMMSFTSGDYFKKTNNFYLPISKYNELKNIDASIVCQNIGYTNFSFEYNFVYASLNNFMGDCITSAYCITTGG